MVVFSGLGVAWCVDDRWAEALEGAHVVQQLWGVKMVWPLVCSYR